MTHKREIEFRERTKDCKNARISLPVLALPNSTGCMTPDNDACDVQIGCVIFQMQPDVATKPFGYWQRALTDT